MTPAAGIPRPISPARFGPESTATGTPGSVSPSTSLIRSPRSRSIPFVQERRIVFFPKPASASNAETDLKWLEGTARKRISPTTHSSSEVVGRIKGERGTLGRYLLFSPSVRMDWTWAGSCPQMATSNPLLAIRRARAVPQPPAPITLTLGVLIVSRLSSWISWPSFRTGVLSPHGGGRCSSDGAKSRART